MLVYSGILTFVIGTILHKTIGFRVSAEEEAAGIDGIEHAETGYDLGSLGSGMRGVSFGGTQPVRTTETDEGPAGARGDHDEEEVKA